MLNLTREEQLIVVMLAAGLLVGAAVLLFRGRLEPPETGPADFTVKVTGGRTERSREMTKTVGNLLPAGKLNLNEASVEELELLPGIGPVLARRIVEWREKNGGFNDTREVMDVNGIGEVKFKLIEGLVTVD